MAGQCLFLDQNPSMFLATRNPHSHTMNRVRCGLQARALRPCIIFMDEIDAVGRIRGGARGNDERDQTLNQVRAQSICSHFSIFLLKCGNIL